MKIRRMVSFTTAILLVTLATVFFAARAGAVAIYEPPEVKTVRAYYVNDLGRISGQFTPGTLQKGDFTYLRFPDGFIWTTANINAEQAKAAAACQSTEEWNTMEVTPDNAIYGTSNYIRVPAQISGAANGLYKITTPVLHFTRQKDNEVLMEIVEDLDTGLECFLDINATRVYVDRPWGIRFPDHRCSRGFRICYRSQPIQQAGMSRDTQGLYRYPGTENRYGCDPRSRGWPFPRRPGFEFGTAARRSGGVNWLWTAVTM